jgi:hypothetical protein
MAEAESRYVPQLKETARLISEGMGAGPVYPPARYEA